MISSNKDTDAWGVIIPYNTANKRFRQSEEWNTLHSFKTLNVSSENYSIVVGGDTYFWDINNFMTFLAEAEKPETSLLCWLAI